MDDGRLENLLGVLALALSDRVRAAAGGLNASEQAALITLRAHPDRPVAWLGAVLGLTDSGATRLADRLVSTGDVQRVPGDDARRRHLRLTYQGITHADALLAARQASLGETTSELSARDRATLERLLERLVEGLAQAPLPALRICRLCDRRACMGDSSCPLGHTTQSRDEPREDGRPGGGGRLSIDRKAGSGSSWFAVAVTGTAMIAVSFGLARYGYGLLLPEMRADLGLSASAAGAISSASYAAYVVTNAAVVVVLRRWGVRTAVAAAASSAAAGMGLVAVATTPGVLAAGIVLAGAAAGFAFPPYADVVHRTMPERRRTGAWSTISSGTGWGVAVAGPLAVFLGDRWRLVWLVFVAITVVVGVCAVLTAPPGRGAADGAVARGRARSPLRRAGARPLLLSALLVGAGSSIWWSFAVDAMRAAGLGSDLARLTYAGCGIASILASFTGHLVGRTGLRRATRWSVAALAVALATFGTATGTTLAAVTTSVLFGIVYAAVIAAQGLWSATVFTDRPSLGLASTNTALAVGLVTGPVLAGILIDLHGHTTAFWVAAAVVAPAALLAPTDRDARPTHDEAPPPP